jgi:hypothetical protein
MCFGNFLQKRKYAQEAVEWTMTALPPRKVAALKAESRSAGGKGGEPVPRR